MWLTRVAIDRPMLTVLLTLALMVGGAAAWRRMPVDLNPQAELPNVIITVIYPGAAPSTVEALVAEKIEDAVRGVSGVDHVFSVSQESFCYLYVECREGTNIDRAMEQCREAVGRIRANLPEGVREPGFSRLDINAQPVLFLGLVGQRPLEELRRLADQQLKPRLRGVAGVAEVEVLGGRRSEVAIEIDREKLHAQKLTLSSLLDPLKGASRDVPGGRLRQGDKEVNVRLMGEFTSLDDIANVPVPPSFDPGALAASLQRKPPAREPSKALRLGDLATIRRVAVDPDVRIRLQQREAVGVIISKQGRGNTVQIARDARAAALSAGLPSDVEVLVARDTSETVHEALSDVNASIIAGVILCSVTMLLFLRNWRGTVIVATSIPMCLVGTFALMGYGGNTLNQMTLLGLALSVGILVDDSIVCLEAITWRLQRGEAPPDAAFHGRNDIALADTSTTLLDLAVFVPIAVMQGVVGQFFRDFGFVVAAAAALSLLAAYTLVPMLAAWWYTWRPLGPREAQGDQLYERLEHRYREVLEWVLHHRGVTLACGWGSLLLAGLLAARLLGTDFVPPADLSTIQVNVEMPAGSATSATEKMVARAEAIIAQDRDVRTLFTTLGKTEAGFGVVSRLGPQYAQINVTLRDRLTVLDTVLLRGRGLRRRSDAAVAAELRRKLSGLGDARWQVIAVHGWGGAGAPIDFSIYGRDLEQMAALGDEIMKRLDKVPGLLNPDLSWRLGQPEVQVRLNRSTAREVYVYPGAVGRELRTAIEGEADVTMSLGGELVPVRLRLREDDRRNAADLARLPVGKTDQRAVTVADVARISEGRGPTRIDRRDGLRDLNFKAYLDPSLTLGEAQQRIERIMAELGAQLEGRPAPAHTRFPGLRWGWRGDADTLAASTGYMINTALVAVLLVYAIMAVLFNSLVHPFTILLSVPMAIAGALLALVVTGSSMSIVSGIGLILLLGIVTRNAILLIDHMAHLRRQGVRRHEAVVESGVRRLRPILMTTFSTIMGMAPVALKIGKGAEIRAPMAIAVIGGLLLSTALTLLIIPVTYTILDEWFSGREPSAEDGAQGQGEAG